MGYVIIGRYTVMMVNFYGYFMLTELNYLEAGFAMGNLDNVTKTPTSKYPQQIANKNQKNDICLFTSL